MRLSTVVCATATLALCLASGCVGPVELKFPRNNDLYNAVDAASPSFSWACEGAGHKEYTLTVARDAGFSDVVFEKARITNTVYQIKPGVEDDSGWLRGGETYHWKVEGILKDENGEITDSIECVGPRSFELDKRDEITIDIRVPSGARVHIGDDEFSSNSTLEMENGEVRPMSVSRSGTTMGGMIQVVQVTPSAKLGKVIIDDLEGFMKDDAIFTSIYTIGEDEIVVLRLGAK